jgi:hypothetical protein
MAFPKITPYLPKLWIGSWLLPSSVDKQLVLRNRWNQYNIQVILLFFKCPTYIAMEFSTVSAAVHIFCWTYYMFRSGCTFFGNMNQTAFLYVSVPCQSTKKHYLLQHNFHQYFVLCNQHTGTLHICFSDNVVPELFGMSLKYSVTVWLSQFNLWSHTK